MNKIFVLFLVALSFYGCSSDSDTNNNNQNSDSNESYQTYIDAPKSSLTQDVIDALNYMGDEERLAYDLYLTLYDTSGANQFYNIATKSETKHIEAVKQMLIKYDINTTELYNHDLEDLEAGEYANDHINDLCEQLLEKGVKTKQDALEVGCIVEVVDIDDLDKYIAYAQTSDADDVVGVFDFLRQGSYKHYWAFDGALKDMGVTEGCCSAGEEYCKTSDEYPQTN